MHGLTVRTAIRYFVGVVVVVHGLIHLLGAAGGFGWANVDQLGGPIGAATGAAWLAAAVVTVAAGVALIGHVPWWWIIGAVAVVISQVVIITSWADARIGTIVNGILLVAVIYGWASQGPRSSHAEYRRRISGALADLDAAGRVTDIDIERLPAPVAAYVRRSGALGQPRVINFNAHFHGRIRSGPGKRWMTFTGEQVNTYGPHPSRLFHMDATMLGLPVDVLHVLVGGTATMRVKACSLVTMVNAAGPEMDRAETVTLFNDMCVLAPAALVDAPVTWQVVDEHHVSGTYANSGNVVAAELIFDDHHELVNFFSDDRVAISADGRTSTPQRWSTPICDYRDVGPRRVGTTGEGRWSAPGGEYAYVEYNLDRITYNDTHVPSPHPLPGGGQPNAQRPQAPSGGIAAAAAVLSRVWGDRRSRIAIPVALAVADGALAGWWIPRGPMTGGQALAAMAISVVVGAIAGVVMRSRWAMLLAPVVFARLSR